jgi:hypothetical protein
MRMLSPTDPSLEEFVALRDRYVQDRKQSFDFAVQLTDEIAPLLEKLQRITKYAFDAHESIMRENVARQVTGPQGVSAENSET